MARLDAAVGAPPNGTLHEAAAGTTAARLTLRRAPKLSVDRSRYSQLARLVHDLIEDDGVEDTDVDFPAFVESLKRGSR